MKIAMTLDLADGMRLDVAGFLRDLADDFDTGLYSELREYGEVTLSDESGNVVGRVSIEREESR